MKTNNALARFSSEVSDADLELVSGGALYLKAPTTTSYSSFNFTTLKLSSPSLGLNDPALMNKILAVAEDGCGTGDSGAMGCPG